MQRALLLTGTVAFVLAAAAPAQSASPPAPAGTDTASVASIPPLSGPDSAQRLTEAMRLLHVMHMDRVLRDGNSALLDEQIKVNPGLAPYRDVIAAFLARHASFEAVGAQLAAVYAAAFTAPELNQLADFYATPLGQKTTRLMPELIRRGGEIGRQAVLAHQDELQALLQARREELKEHPAPPSP